MTDDQPIGAQFIVNYTDEGLVLTVGHLRDLKEGMERLLLQSISQKEAASHEK